MTSAVISQRATSHSRVASIILIVAGAALTAVAAQWRIELPFTPVPITGQTFAVLLSGAALGSRLGGASQLLYLAAGAVGLPVFTGGDAGWEVLRGTTSGYLFGFVLAAYIVGRHAEKRQDRTFATMFTTFFAGSAVIYICGVIGLLITTPLSAADGVAQGVVPFVVGDVIKATAAGLLLPTAWRLVGDR